MVDRDIAITKEKYRRRDCRLLNEISHCNSQSFFFLFVNVYTTYVRT